MDSFARDIRLSGGRTLRATPVFDTYWRFACERQEIFHKRVLGLPPPWTEDRILQQYRFTNAYRASDRVSQFLIGEVLYKGDQSPSELFFRALLFKLFNRIETWQHLSIEIGTLSWSTYSFDRYACALDALFQRGGRVYSPAYIMPSPAFGEKRKHRNHLRLLEQMMRGHAPEKVQGAGSLEEVYRLLLSYRSLGPFLAFQFAIDLNYSTICDFSERDFVIAGPGARNGIRKCFEDTGGLSDEEVIQAVGELVEPETERLGIIFKDLWGRPLHLIDCQNLFCEVDKYAREAHPAYSAKTGRSRIKRRYEPLIRPVPQWYPPKWNLDLPARSVSAAGGAKLTSQQLELATAGPLAHDS